MEGGHGHPVEQVPEALHQVVAGEEVIDVADSFTENGYGYTEKVFSCRPPSGRRRTLSMTASKLPGWPDTGYEVVSGSKAETAGCLHALSLMTECLMDNTEFESALGRSLSIVADVVPGELFLLKRMELDSLREEFSSWLNRSGGGVDTVVLNRNLQTVAAEYSGPGAPSPGNGKYFLVTECGRDRRIELDESIHQVTLAAASVDGGWMDFLLVGGSSRWTVDMETAAFFSSVLRLVRLSADRLGCKRRELADHRRVLRAKQEWQSSVDVLPQLICLISADGLVLRANRTLEELGLGMVQDVTGDGFMELLERLGVIDDIAGMEDIGTAARREDSPLSDASDGVRGRIWRKWWRELDRQPIQLGPLATPRERLFKLRLKKSAGRETTADAARDEAICVAVLEDVTERERTRSLIESYNKNLQRQVKGRTRQLRRMNMALLKEINAHNRDEQALKLSETKYHTLAENTCIGIYLVENGRVCYCNSRFTSMLGYAGEALLGRRLEAIFGSGFEQRSPVAASFLAPEGSVRNGGEFSARKKDGCRVWLQVHQAQFADGRKEIVIGNVVDITARKEYELRLKEEKMRTHELSDQLLVAQETERRRIARELHDGVGQRLSAIRLRVDQFLEGCEDGPGRCREQFAEIGERTKEALDEVRRVSMDLRPSLLDDLGIIATLRWFLREFGTTAPHIEVLGDIAIDETGLDAVVKTQIFRIVQEAFNNIVKHADATSVRLTLSRTPDRLVLKIRDDGKGLGGSANLEYAGLGLRSMLERAELSGGDLFLASRFQSGVSITAVWPATPVVAGGGGRKTTV